MKQLKWIGIAGVAILLVAGFSACRKTNTDNADNITSAQDYATAETEFSGAFDITDDVNQSDGKIKKGASTLLPSGAIFTWDDSLFTDGDGISYSIDFGTLGTGSPLGMVCGDGRYRAGVLHVSVSDRYLNIGTMVTVSAQASDNYYSGDGTNMFQLEGSLKVTRTAAEELTVEVENGKLTDGSGQVATFKGARVIKRLSGSGTPGILGDVYQVTGSGSGTNRQGDDYTWQITTPLIKKIELGCARTFVKGVIEIKNVTANSSLQVDFDPYGNSACDRIAEATIGTKKIIFTVR